MIAEALRNHYKQILACAFVAGVVFVLTWIKATPSYLNEARAKHFPLVRALEIYYLKNGHYPKKIATLTEASPGFDPSLYKGYDQYENCDLTQGYCLKADGSYEIRYDVGAGIACTFTPSADLDFRCHD